MSTITSNHKQWPGRQSNRTDLGTIDHRSRLLQSARKTTTHHTGARIAVAAAAAVSARAAVQQRGAISQQLAGLALDRRVLGLVEVAEKEQEHDAVQADPHHERVRIVALAEQQLELVCEDRHELHLHINTVIRQSETNRAALGCNITIWNVVRYFFHQMNFWYCGPMAATM